jgi:L-aspartate oxidase
MLQEHSAGELAPRDIVARSVWRRLQAGQRVFLDGRSAIGTQFPQRFPTVFAHCQQHGLDPRHDPVPIVPAAHYHMGGVAVDLQGRTSRPGLWACGEVASTGVHGANRLASNSLLEALVFARRVSQDVRRCLESRRIPSRIPELGASDMVPADPGADSADLIQRIRTIMWEQVGLVRTEAGLVEARLEFRDMAAAIAKPKAADVRNMLTAAQLIVTAALSRRESRGAHFRADYPETDTLWAGPLASSRAERAVVG